MTLPVLVVEPDQDARADAHALVQQPVPVAEWAPNVVAPALVTAPDGRPLLAALRYPADDLARLRRAILRYPMNTTLRAAGIRNVSNTFGFTSRRVMMQRNCCRRHNSSIDAPDAHAGLVASAAVLAGLVADVLPDLAAEHAARTAEAILPEWTLPGSPWTSGVLNRTSPLGYHYDRNNLEPVWSAMVVCRRHVRGGHLHVPELGLVVDCRDGDVVAFPGWRHVHGVTPLRKTQEDGYRFSAVFYAVAAMGKCLPFEQEVEHGRVHRTRREDDLRSADDRLGPRRGT